jgi:hypothetical protein
MGYINGMQAIQEVMAPKGVGVKVPRGQLKMKKELVYNRICRESDRPKREKPGFWRTGSA